MNSYHRRKVIRDRRVAAIQDEARTWKKIKAENFIAVFSREWERITGIRPHVTYKDGWYYFNGKRRSKLYLQSRLQVEESKQHERELGE